MKNLESLYGDNSTRRKKRKPEASSSASFRVVDDDDDDDLATSVKPKSSVSVHSRSVKYKTQDKQSDSTRDMDAFLAGTEVDIVNEPSYSSAQPPPSATTAITAATAITTATRTATGGAEPASGTTMFSNRFGIQPGPLWDGIDRSNGFERRILAQSHVLEMASSTAQSRARVVDPYTDYEY